MDKKVCYFLKEERKRLNYSQKNIADFLGMSVKQVGRWESSVAISADKLALLAELGFDVQYVVTGKRTRELNIQAIQDCIEIIEEVLQETNKKLTPIQKAKVLTVLYEDYIDDAASITPERVIRQLRLVA